MSLNHTLNKRLKLQTCASNKQTFYNILLIFFILFLKGGLTSFIFRLYLFVICLASTYRFFIKKNL